MTNFTAITISLTDLEDEVLTELGNMPGMPTLDSKMALAYLIQYIALNADPLERQRIKEAIFEAAYDAGFAGLPETA